MTEMKCKCKDGYSEYSGKCSKGCFLENEEDLGQGCVCKEGHQRSTITGKCEDVCRKADSYSFYSLDLKKC